MHSICTLCTAWERMCRLVWQIGRDIGLEADMSDLLLIIVIALACPLALPLVIREDEDDRLE